MPGSNANLFCFFSGFAHRVIDLLNYRNDFDRGLVFLDCYDRGEHDFSVGDYIQLNGVLFEVVETSGSYFTGSSTMELLNNTSINRAKPGDRLTLGILADKDLAHDQMWMLHPSASGEVTYKDYSVLDGHEHMLKLDFEAPIEMASLIQDGCHLGLSGSSLTARDVVMDGPLIKFSIYCGRETREQTQFNQDLRPGTRVNITEPAGIENRLNP